MADFPVTENPVYSSTMEQITTQERGHPDTFNPRYQTLLDNDNFLKEDLERKYTLRTLTLPASEWSAEAPYTQTVQVEGLTAGDNPLLVKIIQPDMTPEQVKAYNKAIGMIDDGDTGDGTATFKCFNKKPTIDLIVGLKGV